MAISKELRNIVYNKFNGLCAYSGTELEYDWQIDHIVPKKMGGSDDLHNLIPAQRIINHYKRGLPLDVFRNWFLKGLHIRLGKLPKNPRSKRGINRKEYLLDVAQYFGITKDNPFNGKFYFEKRKELKNIKVNEN